MKNLKIFIIISITSLFTITSCQKENLTNLILDKQEILSPELTIETIRTNYPAHDRNSTDTDRMFPVQIKKVVFGRNGKRLGTYEKISLTRWIATAVTSNKSAKFLERICRQAGMIHLVDRNQEIIIELDLVNKIVRFKDMELKKEVKTPYEIIAIIHQKLHREEEINPDTNPNYKGFVLNN